MLRQEQNESNENRNDHKHCIVQQKEETIKVKQKNEFLTEQKTVDSSTTTTRLGMVFMALFSDPILSFSFINDLNLWPKMM